MSKIKYELFGCDAEISAFETDAATELLLDFGRSLEGLVSIENVVSRVTGGVCRFDSRLVDQGEHTPMLILKDKVITLPGIVKAGGKMRPALCTDEYTRNVSIRERRLSLRVEELEKAIKLLENKITRTIF